MYQISPKRLERILITAGAKKRSTYTEHQTRLLCPNGQTISFSLVHPVIDENHVSKIRKRFGMSTSAFKHLYDTTPDERQ